MRQLCLVLFSVLLLFASPLVSAQGASHQAMLASVYSGETAVHEYWVSEKLDGVRGHWDGEALWSRGGYPIAAPGWFTQGWPAMAMDGELWIARELFDTVSGIVRSSQADDKDWRRVKFMVFDLPDHGGTFDQRVRAMANMADNGIPWLQSIPQFRVTDATELDARLEALVAAGSEGVMLHHQDALYRSGRTQDLLKYKLYDDAEARVVGYTEGKGKYARQVGALVVEREDGRRFRLGSGLSDKARATPPPLGSWVTYRYNGLTSSGLPRFARFVRMRNDMPELAGESDARGSSDEWKQ
ncbi:DNA ligase [Halopseudomonas pelagia]|uniref:DNA ligase n=1 Tax=Halopseudomonas pelagia TaxID=553151 RepID=UPI0030DAF2AE|tara:strand:+ start:62 stop:958 length:897 start_codon:yes stop_codon:yes gene_type:complete